MINLNNLQCCVKGRKRCSDNDWRLLLRTSDVSSQTGNAAAATSLSSLLVLLVSFVPCHLSNVRVGVHTYSPPMARAHSGTQMTA